VCERRGVGVRCHDPPHDEAARPSLRPFHTVSPRRWVNRLFLDTPVNELLLGSALGTLVVLHFRREPPYDQQQLREQGAQKYQEESHAHSSAVVGLMHL
jgi:hypothetical protein